MTHIKYNPNKGRWWTLVVLSLVMVGAVCTYWSRRATITAEMGSGHYDVIVVGAGPSGIAASIQAARMGAHVALIEETDWVGGQMTAAGVGTMDEGDNNAARKSGVYHEFYLLAAKLYKSKGHSYSTCYFYEHSLCVDPKDGQAILRQMLQKEAARLTLITGAHTSAVTKTQGGAVTGVVAAGKHYTSKVVIDASEYGDILAQSGAAYRLGNGTSDKPKPNGCVQAITHAAIIKYYRRGVPKELQFTKAPPGYTVAIRNHFLGLISKTGNDYMTTKKFPYSFKSFTAWRGFPNLSEPYDYDVNQKLHGITRTGLNQGNDYPLGKGLSSAAISDPAARLESTCQAKLLTLQMVYFIQHDLGQDHWSVANDEGYNTEYNRSENKKCPQLSDYEAFTNQMPQEPYVREGRRLIGTQTLTGEGLSRRSEQSQSGMQQFKDSIAVGYYPVDLHACKTPETLEKDLDSSNSLEARPSEGAFEVPMGVLIPQTVDGLLAAEKNISVSRLAEGAIREQPIAMNIGQAAGALAALAAKDHTQPRNVPASEVQRVLSKAHAIYSVR